MGALHAVRPCQRAVPLAMPCQRAGQDQEVELWVAAPALGQQPWGLPGAVQGQGWGVSGGGRLVWKGHGNLAWTEEVTEAWKLGEKRAGSVGVTVAWRGAEKGV